MQTVTYGRHRIDLIDGAGGLIRPTERGDDRVPRARHVRAPTTAIATPLGRAPQVAHAIRALGEGRTANFHGPCGIGKTTLLRHLALEAARTFGRPGAYLEVEPNEHPHDVVQRLLHKLGLFEPHVRATAAQSARMLAAVQPVVVIDKDDGELSTLLDHLPRCLVIVGSEHPITGPGAISYELPGLADDDALVLLSRDAGRELDAHEQAAATRLVAAVDGRPLPLRQAASLVRAGLSSFAALADAAERDGTAISWNALNGLDRIEHNVISILAVFGGVLLPADLVEIIGDAGKCREALVKLRDRRVIESSGDRFGFPACRAPDNMDHFFRTFDAAAAVRDIVQYVGASNPGTDGAISLMKAVVTLIGVLARRRQWNSVVALVEVAEPILTLAGRWATCHRLLDIGIHAAREVGDWTAEAMFRHEQGTLALARGDVDVAREQLSRAYQMRRQAGDDLAAEVSLRNLQLLPAAVPTPGPPPPPPPPRRKPNRRWAVAAAAVAILVLLTALVNTVTDDHGTAGPLPSPTTSSPAVDPSLSSSAEPTQSIPPTGSTGGGGGPDPDPGAAPSLTPRRANLGRYHLGSSDKPLAETLTLRNDRDVAVAFGPPRLTSTEFFAENSDCGSVVPPHATCAIKVVFGPKSTGRHEVDVVVPLAGFPAASAHLSALGFRNLTVSVVKENTDVGTVFDRSKLVNCESGSCVYEVSETPIFLGLTIETCEGCFAGFAGCDDRKPFTCKVDLNKDRTVTAIFRHPEPEPVVE